MSDAVCKGAWQLGSACGECSRCITDAPRAARALYERATEAENNLRTGYLIEGPGPCYLYVAGGAEFGKSHFDWTADANRALRFTNMTQADEFFCALRTMNRELFTSAFPQEPRPVAHSWVSL
ncbi:MAG: hypothetical protein IT547_18185 [Hyphomonadaceae bacterium]|nr:hypothetical protein [Hyphomonadaceae bacterium]